MALREVAVLLEVLRSLHEAPKVEQVIKTIQGALEPPQEPLEHQGANDNDYLVASSSHLGGSKVAEGFQVN